MIGYIKGKLTFKSPTYVYIETGGVGYVVHISLQTYSKIESKEEAMLFTSLIVREDSHTLYGFFDEVEKTIFNHLISVSGVGPNTGRVILSTLSSSDVRNAILTDRPDAFKIVKGVGPKTAQKIILDLKDKLIKMDDIGSDGEFLQTQGNTAKDEALSALVALGFIRQKARTVIDKIAKEATTELSVEEIIKASLKLLS